MRAMMSPAGCRTPITTANASAPGRYSSPRTRARDIIKQAIRADFSDAVWDALKSNISAPRSSPGTQIAVKVLDDRGDELLVVKRQGRSKEMTDSPQEPKYAGARFYKCALQVNPYTYAKNFQGGSGQDEEAYNQAILDQCKEHDIKIVGLADHGKVGTSQSLRDFLAKNSIVVFPGFEISSSEKIHMVCLYPQETSPAQLNQYLGQLMGKNASRLNDMPRTSVL